MTWLSGWSYRKEITITGQSGAGTDFQVIIDIGDASGGDVHLENHCTNFPQDIAVTDNDGTTPLDFWIEDVAADPIAMWVEVADDLGSNRTIYIYYGKSGASTDSDGDATFIQWRGNATATYTELTGVPTGPYVYETKMKETTGVTNHFIQCGLRNTTYAAGYDDTHRFVSSRIHNFSMQETYNEGSYTREELTGQWFTAYQWYRVRLVRNTTPRLYLYLDDVQQGGYLSSNISDEEMGLCGKADIGGFEQAWSFVRKYNATEPAFSSAGSEEKATVTNAFDGKIKIIEKLINLFDGEVDVKDEATGGLDGKVRIKDEIINLADGLVKVIESVTSVVDGKVIIKDVVTALADGKVRIKDIAIGLLDGKVRISDFGIGGVDGKIRIKDVITSLADGKIKVIEKVTNIVDGKVKIIEKVINLVDGKVRIKDKATNLLDGLIRIKDEVTGGVDGKINIKDAISVLVDGKVRIKDVAISLLDGKIKIKDSITSLVDGKIKILNVVTSLADGKIHIIKKLTNLLDGLLQIPARYTISTSSEQQHDIVPSSEVLYNIEPSSTLHHTISVINDEVYYTIITSDEQQHNIVIVEDEE